jgi:chemotaxis protein CheX
MSAPVVADQPSQRADLMTDTSLLFPDGAIAEITREIFDVMFGADLVEVSGNGTPQAEVTSLIHVTGETPCTVQLVFAAGLGTRLTATMFGLPEGELDDSSIADALGELANMVGGSVKSMLPAPSRMSLPSVTVNVEDLHFPGARPSDIVTFSDGHGFLTVVIWRPDLVQFDHHRTTQ